MRAIPILLLALAATVAARPGAPRTRRDGAHAGPPLVARSVHVSPRLTTAPITLRTTSSLADGGCEGGGGGDTPPRFSGFFKLNRTSDAHMFYQFYGRSEEKRAAAAWEGGDGSAPTLSPFLLSQARARAPPTPTPYSSG